MDEQQSQKRYHELQEWYQHPAGKHLLHLEKKLLDRILPTCFGYYLLQLGGCATTDMTSTSPIHEKIFFQTEEGGKCNVVGEMEDLPFATGSVDVIIAHHIIEFSNEPHAILREIERVLMPEGYLILFCFNPIGWYGMRRMLTLKKRTAPWSGYFFSAYRLADWLNLLGICLLSQRRLCVTPPIDNEKVQEFLAPLENCFSGFSWVPMSGAYMFLAKKQVSTLTPVKAKWWHRRMLGVSENVLRPTTYDNHE